MRILIVEDDQRTAAFLERGLTEAGHVVDKVADGATGLAMALEGIYDVLVLDRLVPEMNGLDVARALRERDIQVPILMLSALSNSRDKIDGLKAGVDDYLAKPYAFVELSARLDALLRRKSPSRRTNVLRVADLELDTQQRRAIRGGRRIDLQHREFVLLELLMRHAGQIVTRAMLLEAAWPYDFEPRGNIVDMHIHRLRRKIEHDLSTPLIQTVPGAGYLIAAPDRAE
jgi:two-component system OmpR family response regulator